VVVRHGLNVLKTHLSFFIFFIGNGTGNETTETRTGTGRDGTGRDGTGRDGTRQDGTGTETGNKIGKKEREREQGSDVCVLLRRAGAFYPGTDLRLV
jgi:hypothetical protein